MASQPESILVRKIKQAIEQKCPRAIVVKLADKFTRGLPDILVIGVTREGTPLTIMLEAKTPDGKQSALQKAFEDRVAVIAAFSPTIQYRVVRSVQDALEATWKRGMM